MREGDLEAKLERAEETYEDLVRTRASLGTVLAEAAHGRAAEAASRTLASLEEAKKSHAKAASLERRSGLEARRLKELRDVEAERLERLRAEEREPHEVAT